MRSPARDSISLSPATVRGFNTIGIGDFNAVEMPERMAFVVMILRGLKDNEERFPRGKWATIQEIERQLHECADQIAASLE